MAKVKLDLKNLGDIKLDILEHAGVVEEIHNELIDEAEEENNFLGWLKLPEEYDKKEFDRIKKCAEKIRSDSDFLVVIGIGGSYLGARAVIEALHSSFDSYK